MISMYAASQPMFFKRKDLRARKQQCWCVLYIIQLEQREMNVYTDSIHSKQIEDWLAQYFITSFKKQISEQNIMNLHLWIKLIWAYSALSQKPLTTYLMLLK